MMTMKSKGELASAWMKANYAQLEKQYPFEWVVTDENGVVGHDKDVGKALRHVKKLDDVAICYLDMQGA